MTRRAAPLSLDRLEALEAKLSARIEAKRGNSRELVAEHLEYEFMGGPKPSRDLVPLTPEEIRKNDAFWDAWMAGQQRALDKEREP